MLKKINGELRVVAITVVSVLVLLKITKNEKKETRLSGYGFQSEEFDDIW